MKKKVVTTLCGTMILLVGMGTGAFASSHLQEIKAFLNGDLKIRVNGEITPLKDGNGKAVLPITYKGTTYLPVRSVSELLDVPVNYDGTAKEVIIGEQQAGIPVKQEDFNTSLHTKDPALTKYGGKNYKEVLYSAPNSNIKYTALSPNGKYQKLVLQFAAVGKEVESIEIRDNDKNVLLKKVEKISPNSDLQMIEVDISGVKNVAINVTQAVDGGFIIPLDTSIYK